MVIQYQLTLDNQKKTTYILYGKQLTCCINSYLKIRRNLNYLIENLKSKFKRQSKKTKNSQIYN